MRPTAVQLMRRAAALLLCLVLAFALLPPARAAEHKVVRVGWYESTYNSTDEAGRRSGYAYEYQLKLAAYTGWTYEYVHGSWPVLLEMLENGQLDLMSDVSYTAARAERMLFPSLPMGTEEYYLFVAPRREDIVSSDAASLDGKRVGVNKGSVQAGYYRDWAKRSGVTAELVEVSCSEDESLQMLENGALDAYITVDSFTDPERAVPVFKIGSSDFFFAVNQERPDLLDELNEAMDRIQDENRYFNQEMYEKHIKPVGANSVLTADEKSWLAGHGAIRVGYQDHYLAFCAADAETGELTGLLKDYLAYAADCLANAQLDFEARAYPTASAALEALERGEVDCVFPANLSPYDGEELGLAASPVVMCTEIYAVVRQSDQSHFANRAHVIVAVDADNPNYDAVLRVRFPGWRRVYYPDTEDCLRAVASGVADCVLISNYRYNNLARLCDKLRLTVLSTGAQMDYSFAVGDGSTELYSILAKAAGMVPDTVVNASMSYYITQDARLTLFDFLVDNLTTVLLVVSLVVAVILFLLFETLRAFRRANRLISATEHDELTGLYNRSFFFQYAERRFREHPDVPMDALVLNIEQFHSVNALNGREFGDRVLRVLGAELRAAAEATGGIAGRFEADRFDIYCPHTDDYSALFERVQAKLDSLSPNSRLLLRMGVAPWQEGVEPVQLFDRARTACSMARGNFKERLIVFNEEVRERELLEQRLLGDLRRALDNFEFEVFYQPKYDIQSDPPRLVSAEALVRWRHPELGMIAPMDFIPLFEKNGQIAAVDKYVWSEAARQVVRWRAQYGVTIPVSVNLSRVDVFDPSLEDTLDGILRYNGLEPDAFKLEVTESAYTENADQVVRVVENLRAKGYEVEMDDFGTGYSSLNMLSAMPIDVLKMDRAFVRNIEHDEKDVQLVALILNIAKSLNVPVVAEGVETEEQLKLLRSLGCAVVQGYYFSRPLHAADFEAAFLRGESAGEGR